MLSGRAPGVVQSRHAAPSRALPPIPLPLLALQRSRRAAGGRRFALPAAALGAAPARPDLAGDESSGSAFGDTPRPIPLYDEAAWTRHRSAARYLRHARTAPSSSVLRNLFVPIVLSAAVTLLLAAYAALRRGSWPPLASVGLAPLGLSSSALSLLLVFRTNSSYQRFTEARTAWGNIVNRTRDLVREAVTFFGAENVAAKAAVARTHMRDPGSLHASLAAVLKPGELASLCASQHRPNFCLLMLGRLVATAMPEASLSLRIDEDVRAINDSVGVLERFYRTPIPPSYTRNTSRLLLLWFCFMPFALFSELQLWAILAAPLMTLVLGGIDEIGVALEEPGAILPTDALCEAIAIQTAELVAVDAECQILASSI